MQQQKRTITTVAILAGMALSLAAPLARAQMGNESSTTAQRGSFSEKDYRYVEKAARGGTEEVELGQIAQQKGVNPSVRSFGERMAADHGKANTELTRLATTKGATLPTQLSHHERSTIDDLQKASGADFDKTYAKAMVKDHKHDIKEFESMAKNAQDPELKAWAEKTLPTLQEHLRMAEEMEAAVKSEK
jgi:putative membrane protein